MPRKSTMARKMSIQKRLHGMDQFQADAIDPEKERWVRGKGGRRFACATEREKGWESGRLNGLRWHTTYE